MWRGRGAVGVAHAEVDDVFPAAAGGDLHLPGDVEDIGGQALDAAELFHEDSLQGSGIRDQGTRTEELRIGAYRIREAAWVGPGRYRG